MARRGENIYHRKDGRWEGRYIRYRTSDGKAVYGYVYASTYSDVKQLLAQKKFNQSDPLQGTPCQVSFSQIAGLWLQKQEVSVKKTSYIRYRNLLHNHILPFLGTYNLSAVTSQILQEFVIFLSSCGRKDGQGGLSDKTVFDITVVTKAVFRHAELLGYHCCCNLDVLSVRCTKKEMRVLNREEQTVLNHYLCTEPDRTKLGILFSVYTGLRLGEICALLMEDLDLAHNKLFVRHTMQRIQEQPAIDAPKTMVTLSSPKSHSSRREIPIPAFILEYLQDFSCSPHAYILSGTEEKFVEPRTMENRYKRCAEKLHIHGTTFHTLRHTFATRCIEIGVDVKTLSEILGHTNVNVTLNRYVHSSFELKAEDMNKLTALY